MSLPDDCAYCLEPFDPPGQCVAWRGSPVPQERIASVDDYASERAHFLCFDCDNAMDNLHALSRLYGWDSKQ